MKNASLFSLLFLLALPATPAVKGAEPQAIKQKVESKEASKKEKPNLKDTIAKIQANFDKIEDFSSNFKQVSYDKKTKLETISEGVVKFKKPGFMRWDYSIPNKKSFIVDGKSLWIFEPSDKPKENANQAMYDHCFKQDTLTASFSFLWGSGKINEQFDSEYFSDQFGEDPDLNIKLTPKKASTYFKNLILVVDANSYQVKQSIVVDLASNANQFKFSDVKLNTKLKESDFKFTPPEYTHQSPIPGSDGKCK